MKRILLCILIAGLSINAFSQACNSLRYQDTIFHSVLDTTGIYFATATPYGVLAQPQDLYLDIYSPAGDTLQKRPLIVFQFGGGFTIGWRTEPDIPAFCNYFAQLGYVVATIDYRIGLNPLDTASTVRAFYRGVQDERSAIRFLCKNAGYFKLDTNNIILTGTSAGCFCAFANAFMSEADRPLSTFGSSLEPTDMGCMDCSGNTDFGHRIPHIKAIVNCWGAMLDTSYINPGENTPVVSFHGDQDNLVPYVYGYPFQLPVFPPVYGSVPIHERLGHVGILNELHPLVGYSHEPELLAPQLNDTIYNYSRKFLFPLLQPQTSAISGDSVVCAHAPVTYSVINTTGSIYCWTLHNNGVIVQDNGSNVVVMWNDTGNVTISVKELNYIHAEGEERSYQSYVVPHPHSSFTDTDSLLQVSFANTSLQAGNYFWNFGNGDTASVESPVVNYTAGGSYNVMLVADNHVCADTSVKQVVLCPHAGFTYNVQGNQLQVATTNTSGNAFSYLWNFGNGDTSSAVNPVEDYASGGTYTIELMANLGGCLDTARTSITIDSCPVAHFTYNIHNLNGFFYADTTNTVDYTWSFGDGVHATVSSNNVIHIYPGNAIYTVILTVRNQLGCESSDTIVVDTAPSGIDALMENTISVFCDGKNGCWLHDANEGNYAVQLFDIQGKEIEKLKLSGDNFIETNQLAPGVYLLHLSGEHANLVKRFVME